MQAICLTRQSNLRCRLPDINIPLVLSNCLPFRRNKFQAATLRIPCWRGHKLYPINQFSEVFGLLTLEWKFPLKETIHKVLSRSWFLYCPATELCGRTVYPVQHIFSSFLVVCWFSLYFCVSKLYVWNSWYIPSLESHFNAIYCFWAVWNGLELPIFLVFFLICRLSHIL